MGKVDEFVSKTEAILAVCGECETSGTKYIEEFRRGWADDLRVFLETFGSAYPSDLFCGQSRASGPLQMAMAFLEGACLPTHEEKEIILAAWSVAWQGRGGSLSWEYAAGTGVLGLAFSPKHEGGYHQVTFSPEKGNFPCSFPLRVCVLVSEDMDYHECSSEIRMADCDDLENEPECFCEPEVVVNRARIFADDKDWGEFQDWLFSAINCEPEGEKISNNK